MKNKASGENFKELRILTNLRQRKHSSPLQIVSPTTSLISILKEFSEGKTNHLERRTEGKYLQCRIKDLHLSEKTKKQSIRGERVVRRKWIEFDLSGKQDSLPLESMSYDTQVWSWTLPFLKRSKDRKSTTKV